MELELTKLPNGNLQISADDAYCLELKGMQADWDQRGVDADSRLAEVLEHYLANGWEWLQPEEIGALTAAPILSDDVVRDDEGQVVKTGKVCQRRFKNGSPAKLMKQEGRERILNGMLLPMELLGGRPWPRQQFCPIPHACICSDCLPMSRRLPLR
jgi:hypothetical protein